MQKYGTFGLFFWLFCCAQSQTTGLVIITFCLLGCKSTNTTHKCCCTIPRSISIFWICVSRPWRRSSSYMTATVKRASEASAVCFSLQSNLLKFLNLLFTISLANTVSSISKMYSVFVHSHFSVLLSRSSKNHWLISNSLRSLFFPLN